MTLKSEHIRDIASGVGFSACGISRARVLDEHVPRLRSWIGQGLHSDLSYLDCDPLLRTDPSMLLPGTRTMVTCVLSYKNEACTYTGNDQTISAYACVDDYHKVLKGMLGRMLSALKDQNPELKGRTFVDATPLLEKAWAAEGGLGWIGKNSLLITPGFGSYVFIGDLMLDAGCDEYDTPYAGKGCGNCTACIDNCPAGAVRGDRTIDANKCVSRLTTQKRPEGSAPPRTYGWIYGCDACQKCCPYNRKTPLCTDGGFTSAEGLFTLGKEYFLRVSHEDFKQRFGHTPLGAFGLDYIRRNLGTTDSDSVSRVVQPVMSYRSSGNWIFRTHAELQDNV